MLSSLLPGLREIRAPLAAGYLWLVLLWLLLHERVDTGSGAPGAVDALTQLRDAIGLGGVAAAATFLAYVLGALWEPLSVALAEVLWEVRRSYASWRAKRRAAPTYVPADLPEPLAALLRDRTYESEIQEGLSEYTPPRWVRLSTSGWSRLWGIGERLCLEVDEKLAGRLGSPADPEAADRFISELEPMLVQYIESSAAFQANRADPETLASYDAAIVTFNEAQFFSPRDSWWIGEARDFAQTMYPDWLYVRLRGRWRESIIAIEKTQSDYPVMLGSAEVASRLVDELPLVARRLVGEQQELFLEASRMKGEVEFRYAVAIPLPIALSVATFGLGAPAWVWFLATLAGALAGWALLADGWRRDAARNEYLVELLAIDKAKSPTFERLLERAEQARRDQQAPIDEAAASAVLAGPPT